MMKFLIKLTLVFFSLSSYGQMVNNNLLLGGPPQAEPDEWYISNSGTALNSGHSPLTPIDVATFLGKSIDPGDNILFHAGETFVWGEYNITDNSVTVGKWGTGADPILIGSTTYTAATWTSETGGYYSTPLATAPLWVTINGEMARQGESDWIPMTADGTATTLTADLDVYNAVTSLVGVKVRHKEFNFRLSYEHVATNYNTSTNVLTVPSGVVSAFTGYPIKLYGQKQFATQEGDWWYDDPNDKLWIKTAATPSGTDIRVITEEYALKIDGFSGVTIENIDFTQYYETAIDAPDAPSLTIDNVDVHDNRTNGLMFYGNNTTFTLSDFTIERIGLNAIHVGAVSSGDITNGTIDEIGEQANIGWPVDTYWIKTGGCAIAMFWDSGETVTQPTDVDASNVTMSNLGYMGILAIGDNHNFVECIAHDFCEKWNDGAGFYTIHRNTLGTSTKNVTFTRCVAYNGIGSVEGIVSPAAVSIHAEGFYVDNGSELITMDECISYNNTDRGILVNWDTQKTTITDCIVYGNAESQVVYRQNTDPGDSPVFTNNDGNILTGNLIVSADLTYCVEKISYNGDAAYNPFSDSGDSDNNSYVRPYGATVNGSRSTSTGNLTTYTIAAWRTHISDDAASTERYESTYLYKNPIKSHGEEVRIAVNATASPISVDATGYHSITGSALGSSESVAAWSALVYLIDTWPTPDYLYDQFTAANGTAIAGRAPTVGPVPTIALGTHTIQSNQMATSVNGQVYWGINQADVHFTIKHLTSNISTGLNTYFRRVDDSNRLVLAVTATAITLFEFDNSASATNTWTFPNTFVGNFVYFFSVAAVGSNVKVWNNGVLMLDVTTTHLDAGQVGLLGGTTRTTDYVLAEAP